MGAMVFASADKAVEKRLKVRMACPLILSFGSFVAGKKARKLAGTRGFSYAFLVAHRVS